MRSLHPRKRRFPWFAVKLGTTPWTCCTDMVCSPQALPLVAANRQVEMPAAVKKAVLKAGEGVAQADPPWAQSDGPC